MLSQGYTWLLRVLPVAAESTNKILKQNNQAFLPVNTYHVTITTLHHYQYELPKYSLLTQPSQKAKATPGCSATRRSQLSSQESPCVIWLGSHGQLLPSNWIVSAGCILVIYTNNSRGSPIDVCTVCTFVMKPSCCHLMAPMQSLFL